MPEVLLDSEPIDFQGPPPSSIAQVWNLVENHLGQHGALIEQFLVDGDAWSPEGSEDSEGFASIEIKSISQTESVARMVRDLRSQREHSLGRWGYSFPERSLG